MVKSRIKYLYRECLTSVRRLTLFTCRKARMLMYPCTQQFYIQTLFFKSTFPSIDLSGGLHNIPEKSKLLFHEILTCSPGGKGWESMRWTGWSQMKCCNEKYPSTFTWTFQHWISDLGFYDPKRVLIFV